MTNEVAKPTSFEEKMRERIRESLGDLISDEELTKLIKKGIEEAFLAPVPVKNQYGQRQYDGPPFIVQVVKELMTAQVQACVKQWFFEHPEECKKIIADVLQRGLGQAVLSAFDQRFSSELQQFGQNVFDRLRNGG